MTATVERITGEKHKGEDIVTSNIEKGMKSIPSGVFLGLGVVSILASLSLALAGKSKAARFVGLWVPSIFILGVHNKLLKLHED